MLSSQSSSLDLSAPVDTCDSSKNVYSLQTAIFFFELRRNYRLMQKAIHEWPVRHVRGMWKSVIPTDVDEYGGSSYRSVHDRWNNIEARVRRSNDRRWRLPRADVIYDSEKVDFSGNSRNSKEASNGATFTCARVPRGQGPDAQSGISRLVKNKNKICLANSHGTFGDRIAALFVEHGMYAGYLLG